MKSKRLGKRIAAWFLCFAMVMTTINLPEFITEVKAAGIEMPQGTGTSENPYQISTAEELFWFAEAVRNGNRSICAELTNNIVINSEGDSSPIVWSPIGTRIRSFNGTFDGQGHTIKGVYINDETSDYKGLFGYCIGSTIKDLTVVVDITGRGYVGGICGYLIESTVENCSVSGSVSSTSSYVGGICGSSTSYSTVENCSVSGSVSSTSYNVGGICGYSTNYCIVENCSFSGNVTGASDVGGIVGYNDNGSIRKCYNSGSVQGGNYVGGICGYFEGGNLANCYNTGNIGDTSFIGGICGVFRGGNISKCYNLGTISHKSLGIYGSVIGYGDSNSITDCYYLSGQDSVSYSYAESKTADQFASGEVAWLLNGETSEGEDLAWYQTIGTDNYPNFNSLESGVVYFSYADCSATEKSYSNSVGSDTQGNHDFSSDCDATCNVCGYERVATENHNFSDQGDGTHICSICKTVEAHVLDENCKCACGGISHSYDAQTGICSNCKAYQPAELVNDVYQIGNAGQLAWFRDKVNSGAIKLNGLLTSDIDMSPICSETLGSWISIDSYEGVFDGNGYEIRNLYINSADSKSRGVFAYTYGTIKNLGVTGNITNLRAQNVGAVCGKNYGTISNCYNKATVTGTVEVGGVCGASEGSVINCYNEGDVIGAESPDGYETSIGGVCGVALYCTNCFNLGSVTSTAENAHVGGISSLSAYWNPTNCYYLVGTQVDAVASPMTAEQFASGEVAWHLNGKTSEGKDLAWYQDLSEGGDAHPVLVKTANNTVYNYTSCAGIVSYSNDSTKSGDDTGKHTCVPVEGDSENHKCSECGATEPHDFSNHCTCVCGITNHDFQNEDGTHSATCVTCGDENPNKCGESAYYIIEGDTVYVYGTGALKEGAFDGINRPKILEGVEKVVIEYGITNIPKDTFYCQRKVTSIEIPDSVTYIGKEAFAFTDSLLDITIPGSVETIGQSAFYNSNIESITLKEGIKNIGETAFCCPELKELVIPNSVESIGLWAFRCEKLKEATIPCSVKTFGQEIFIFYDKNLVVHVVEGSNAHKAILAINRKNSDEPITIDTETLSHVDEDEDAFCDICGKHLQPMSMTYSHTLTLQSDITLNYYVSADALEGYTNVTLHVEKDVYDRYNKYSLAEETIIGTPVTTAYGNEYKFRYTGIAAYEVGNEVRAYLSAEKDGKVYEFAVDTYSVKKYCYNQLAKSTSSTNLKMLLVDFLNYASNAQTYFWIRPAFLVNADLTNAQKNLAGMNRKALSDMSSEEVLEGATAEISGKTLVLSNTVEMKFYMKLPKEMDKSGVTLKIQYINMNGKKVTKELPYSEFRYSSGEYYVRYDGFLAPEFRSVVSIAIYNNGEQISNLHQYNIETYAYNRLNDSDDAQLKELVRTMMLYSDSAVAYWKSK